MIFSQYRAKKYLYNLKSVQNFKYKTSVDNAFYAACESREKNGLTEEEYKAAVPINRKRTTKFSFVVFTSTVFLHFKT